MTQTSAPGRVMPSHGFNSLTRVHRRSLLRDAVAMADGRRCVLHLEPASRFHTLKPLTLESQLEHAGKQ